MVHERREPAKLPPGVQDLSPGVQVASKKAALAHTGFYRVRIFLPSGVEPGAPDLVVAARDEIEAEAKALKQLGIRSVNKNENTVEIMPASEMEFIMVQARFTPVDNRAQPGGTYSLGVDLRTQKDAEGKLTWTPEGHKAQKTYYVSATGELSDKKEEEK